jgi:hypothetical protein
MALAWLGLVSQNEYSIHIMTFRSAMQLLSLSPSFFFFFFPPSLAVCRRLKCDALAGRRCGTKPL